MTTIERLRELVTRLDMWQRYDDTDIGANAAEAIRDLLDVVEAYEAWYALPAGMRERDTFALRNLMAARAKLEGGG